MHRSNTLLWKMNNCAWSWRRCVAETQNIRAHRPSSMKQKVKQSILSLIYTDKIWSRAHDNAVPCLCCAGRAQATEQRYNKLREKHTELVSSHAELLRKVQKDCRPVLGCLFKLDVSTWLCVCVCNTKCVNVPTECRHCEDAIGNPTDPGRGREDQTAAVV